MKVKKSIYAVFACLVLILTLIQTSCAGESITYVGKQENGITYSLDEDRSEAVATGYYVKDGKVTTDIILPEYVEAGKFQFKVVGVADRAFVGGPWISVTIGSNVKTIGNGAFADCEEIKTVKIEGTNLPYLPENAFEQSVYSKAILVIRPEVSVTGTGWEKFGEVTNN